MLTIAAFANNLRRGLLEEQISEIKFENYLKVRELKQSGVAASMTEKGYRANLKPIDDWFAIPEIILNALKEKNTEVEYFICCSETVDATSVTVFCGPSGETLPIDETAEIVNSARFLAKDEAIRIIVNKNSISIERSVISFNQVGNKAKIRSPKEAIWEGFKEDFPKNESGYRPYLSQIERAKKNLADKLLEVQLE